MRTISLLLVSLFFCLQIVKAQHQPIQSPALNIKSKVERIDLSIKTDLSFQGEPQLANPTARPRVVRVSVRNTGPIAANNFVLEVTYNWRVDHESFTAQSLKRTQSIGSLAAGQTTNIDFVVPDDLIRRNAPFGTPNVSLSFKVDASGVIAETSESNNSASFSLPILNQ